MDGLFTLLSLSFLMAIVSFVIGSLPLSFSLSSSQLRLISSLGMGVLVGTSLIVIIPEGVETLYSSAAVSHTHPNKRDVNIVNGGRNHALDARWQHPAINTLVIRRDISQSEDTAKADSPEAVEPGESGEGGRLRIPGDHKDHDNDNTQAKEKDGAKPKPSSPHAWVGIALISGFILMYLIDTIPSVASASSKHQQRPYVAMHTMHETGATTEMSRRDSAYANGYVVDGRENSQRTQQKSLRDLIATVVGMILPVFLQIGHAH
ncbi:hypothetical protein EMPG_16869 [Blastomyces silverae]|uniref:Solute carrier family 39 (Zinc transporter), member 9 n=1 Tax=Blastomyces silverae TaxID=2060906 RepID=A0A0H1B971_9EURO|nr:hypothetical protein EMPG_16869 [Blastomyces silverae]